MRAFQRHGDKELASLCQCEACVPQGSPFNGTGDNVRMILCAICGNKRCPHATDHRNACTNSNNPGQPGSSYEQCTNPGDISEADLLREDLAYMHAKDSGALDRNRDDRALSLQISRPDAQEREARRNGHG
jgi:hypothetical protein